MTSPADSTHAAQLRQPTAARAPPPQLEAPGGTLATGAQAAGPGRARRVDLVRGGRPQPAQLEPVARPSLAQRLARALAVEPRQLEAIAVLDRDDRGRDPARREQRGDPRRRCRRVVEREDAAEQRAPREEIVSSSATPCSSSGTCSAAATTKKAFGGPPRDARRDDSAIDAALASIPMTRAPGSERARPRTARPSPVPRSTTTRSARAIRCWS